MNNENKNHNNRKKHKINGNNKIDNEDSDLLKDDLLSDYIQFLKSENATLFEQKEKKLHSLEELNEIWKNRFPNAEQIYISAADMTDTEPLINKILNYIPKVFFFYYKYFLFNIFLLSYIYC